MRRRLHHACFDAHGVHDVRGDDGDAFQGDPVQAAYDLVCQSGEWDMVPAGLSREVVDFQFLLFVLPMVQMKALKQQSWKEASIRPSPEWFPGRMTHHRTRVYLVPWVLAHQPEDHPCQRVMGLAA